MTTRKTQNISLYRLASLYGVQTSYFGADHRRHSASRESLLAVLKGLGASIIDHRDVSSALRDRQNVFAQELIEPVMVAWNGLLQYVPIRLPLEHSHSMAVGHLVRETGEITSWNWKLSDIPIAQQILGQTYIIKQLPLSQLLPYGYHRFILEVPGKHHEMLVIAAPQKAYQPSMNDEGKKWGVFLPLYALRSRGNLSSGDFSSLDKLLSWVHELGGSFVATLPLLASFLDEPFEPSPYSPVSRLFWNEFYLDMNKIPEVVSSPAALSALSSLSFRNDVAGLKKQPLVDYRREMALKSELLREVSHRFFNEQSPRWLEVNDYIASNPAVEDYARFRAVCERQGTPWGSWHQKLRNGVVADNDYDQEMQQYYLYVQWLASQQIMESSHKARRCGSALYLDFPVGVHPDGYDAWRRQDLFLSDYSLGAPPDAVFTGGQNWHAPPLHPEELRLKKYDYFIACLQQHMRHAGILRIDHVMSFHRLYWISRGMPAGEGVYVCYRPEELYAILTLESHRNKTVVVGEDLGIVPPEVRPSMARHGLRRMYVAQYQFLANDSHPLGTPPANCVASVNTHDMPPFAAFWQGMDIQYRHRFGLLKGDDMDRETMYRADIRKNVLSYLQNKMKKAITEDDIFEVLKSMLLKLSASKAEMILVNLEDIWLETQPQNVPGTTKYPNWSKKARYSFEEFSVMPEILGLLEKVNRSRLRRTSKK